MAASTVRASHDSTSHLEPTGLRAEIASHLATGLAHDVRNPLNAMAIHLEVLADKLRSPDGQVPPDLEKNLAAARSQIARVDEIVRRFSDFSTGRAPRAADVGELLAQAAALCEHDLRRKGAASVLETAAGLRAAAPPAQLLLLLLSLMLAWSRSVPRGGRIAIHATGGDGITVRARVEGASPRSHPAESGAATLAGQIGATLHEDDGFVLQLPAA